MPELTLDVAKEIVEQGIKHEAWDWGEGATITDELIVRTAQDLLKTSLAFSEQGSVSSAMAAILYAAKAEPLSEASKKAYEEFVRSIGEEPAASNGHAPSEPEPVSAESPGEPEPQPEEDRISSIFPGYDDLKVTDVKKAILASASDGSLSPEEWETIKTYEAAHEERKSILSLEPEFKVEEPEPTPTTIAQGAFAPEAPNEALNRPMPQTVADTIPVANDDDVAAFYQGNVSSIAQQENLPLPEAVDPSQPPPILPIKITDVDDKVLSDLSTQFHSYYVRTLWLLSQEEGRRDIAEHLEREAERDAFVNAYEVHRSEIPEEKQTQPTALEAARKSAEKDAETNETVRNYRARKVRHSAEARELKSLSIGFDKSMFRIKDELERRGLSSRSSASVK